MTEEFKVIIDTREQKPLWGSKQATVSKKLDVGDYTTPFLLGRAHAERKSPQDLYGSIIQGHARFRRMIEKARDEDTNLRVFVECSETVFYKKRFHRASSLKTPESTLRKIVQTISDKYCVDFIFCLDRFDMRIKMLEWFMREESIWQSCKR